MALSFDASAVGTVNASSLTFSHTCTGNNLVLFVGVGDITGTGTWHITGVTYNGVAMTEISHTGNAGGEVAGLFYLINPATGIHNVVISSSTTDFLRGISSSYTGASQVSQPDSSNNNLVSPGTSITTSTTVVAANCWLLSFVANSSALAMTGSTGVNATRNSVDNVASLGDSNGVVATGSQSQTWTFASESVGMVIASVAPVPPPSGGTLLLMGV